MRRYLASDLLLLMNSSGLVVACGLVVALGTRNCCLKSLEIVRSRSSNIAVHSNSSNLVKVLQDSLVLIRAHWISSGPSQDLFELVRTFRNPLEPFKTFQDSSVLT
ncbi:hypothetical protein PtA15_5A706 [Puccinia triticina]|uniref:Uncharacterized protein n=1 Tax=Puccinia triticina TaxID=208348 RepID=A0ABY7CKZ0_9BASI|nr:uncharacterized protein PtA15_5A706 [Puccinia triticina]WAQ85132.1 hypothetical protein PtA15_5A706 [Puccinia triticina]